MRPALAALCLAFAGCRPDLGPPESMVSGSRILAIRGDPPEARPGETVSYRALVVGPLGPLDAPLSWAFCASPRPLTENNAVSAACLEGGRLIPDPSSAPTPTDACQLFGPDPPPGGLRPRAPDPTGGFSQPVRVRLDALSAFRLERVTCELPDAPLEVAIDLARRYRPNQNPSLAPLAAGVDGRPVPLDAIPAGATVTLSTGWAAGDAETFVMFDPASASLVERQERLTVAWFSTAGALLGEVTGGVDGVSETTWQAPATAGIVWVWVVLRDDRGGVDFAGHALRIPG